MSISYAVFVLSIFALAQARRHRQQSDHRHHQAHAHSPRGKFRLRTPSTLLQMKGGDNSAMASNPLHDPTAPAWLDEDFIKMDSDKDGLLSENEFVQGHEGFDRDANVAIMGAIDLNKDNFISETEYLRFVEDPSGGMEALARHKFDNMDVDHNGILDSTELHAQRVAHGSGPAILPDVSITFDEFYHHLAKRTMATEAADRAGMNPELVERIKNLKGDFSTGDVDSDGHLSADELKSILGGLPGFDMLLDVADHNDDSQLDESEFFTFMQVGVIHLAEQEFEHVDQNGNGKIELAELDAAYSGQSVAEMGIPMLFSDMDRNQDGSISLEEFAAFIELASSTSAHSNDPAAKLPQDRPKYLRGAAAPSVHQTKLKGVFDGIDGDTDGFLNRTEFDNYLTRSHFPAIHSSELFLAIDDNHDAKIDFPEFISLVGDLADDVANDLDKADSSPLRPTFDRINLSGDGKLKLHELEMFLASKGQDAHADHLFKVLDKDVSHDLSFEEFSGIGHVAAEIIGSIF